MVVSAAANLGIKGGNVGCEDCQVELDSRQASSSASLSSMANSAGFQGSL